MNKNITTDTVRFATFIDDIHKQLENSIQKSAERDGRVIRIEYEHLTGVEITFLYNTELDFYVVKTKGDYEHRVICENINDVRAEIELMNYGLIVGDTL